MAQYIYGKNVVIQMLKDQKKIQQMYVLATAKNSEFEQIALQQHIPVAHISRQELDKLSENGNHQGIIVAVDEFKTVSLDDILTSIPPTKVPLLLMLDGLEDPHNLGAILRTSDAVGVDGVIIGKHRSVGLTSTVAKVSTGAIDTIKVAEVTNLTQTLKKLKAKGYWVCGADMDKAQDYRQPNFDTPLVLVLGSEGDGISRLVKSECDFCIKLPMLGKVTSLNASVACGILLYQIYSKRFPL